MLLLISLKEKPHRGFKKKQDLRSSLKETPHRGFKKTRPQDQSPLIKENGFQVEEKQRDDAAKVFIQKILI